MVSQDRNEIAEDYAQSLKELTFPSLPIIENLTTIAKENSDVADKILNVIKLRISKSIPDHKLAPLYLLDSICKSVGPPYNILVGDEIYDIFSNVYLLVDDKTRERLVKLFETWKTTRSQGSNSPVFPRDQMDKIERFLRQANSSRATTGSGNSNGSNTGYSSSAPSTTSSSTHTTPSSTPKLPNRPMISDHASKDLTSANLIKDIDTLIPYSQNKFLSNPSDSKLKVRIDALNTLRTLLTSQSLSIKELQTIQDRLRNIMQQEFGSSQPLQLNTTTQASPNNDPNAASQLFQLLVVSGLLKVDQSLIPGSLPKYELIFPKIKHNANGAGIINSNNKNGINSGNNPNSFSSASASSANSVVNTSKSALEQLLSSASMIATTSTTNATSASNSVSQALQNSSFEALKRNELNNIHIDADKLQKYINSNTPSEVTVSLLYAGKPSKCGTCGKRFSDDENGINRRRLHLDWHFRVNKRLSSNASATGARGGIIQSRNWYLDDYEWVKFKDENLLEYSTNSADSNESAASNSKGAASQKKALTEDELPYVVIPATETNMINKCQICQDQVSFKFDDDSGEYRWINCIRAPGEGKNSRKIFHATCYQEASRKRGAEDELKTGSLKRERA